MNLPKKNNFVQKLQEKLILTTLFRVLRKFYSEKISRKNFLKKTIFNLIRNHEKRKKFYLNGNFSRFHENFTPEKFLERISQKKISVFFRNTKFRKFS